MPLSKQSIRRISLSLLFEFLFSKTAIAARLEYLEGDFFFGSEDKLNPFSGSIKEPIFFSRSLKLNELEEHHLAMCGPGIEEKSLFNALREK